MTIVLLLDIVREKGSRIFATDPSHLGSFYGIVTQTRNYFSERRASGERDLSVERHVSRGWIAASVLGSSDVIFAEISRTIGECFLHASATEQMADLESAISQKVSEILKMDQCR